MARMYRPLIISWEITRACNLDCKHCGSAAGYARESELDTSQALDVCKQLDVFKKAHVALTGGEVFVRKDWAVLVEEIIRRRGTLVLQTNGWSLDAERVRELRALRGKRGRISVGISLDGDETVHDRIRKKGSYERVINALKELRAAGFGCALITTVNRLNIGCLEHIRDVVNEHKCYGWQIQATTNFGRAASKNDLVMTPEIYRQAAEKIATLNDEFLAGQSPTRLMVADSIGYNGQLERRLRPKGWRGCQAGLWSMAIQSNGDVKGCLFLLDDCFIEGNVKETTLRDIWMTKEAFPYNRRFDPKALRGVCKECEHGKICKAGCRAFSYSTHGHVNEAGFCLHADELSKRSQDRRSR